MRHMRVAGTVMAVGVMVVGAFGVAGCGDDDAGGATETSADAGTDTTAAGAETISSDEGTGSSGSDAEWCALANELFTQDGFPTAAQLTHYQEVAPAGIQPEVDALVVKWLPVLDDPVGFLAVLAEDESEEQIEAIDELEESECGIPHSEQNSDVPGATREVEPAATRVDVSGVEFDFELAGTVAPGRTSFVFTNEGAQPHYLGVARLAEGVTIDEVLAAEDTSGLFEGEWDTDLAAPLGDDEVITFDVEPGVYAMVCFLPDADGTPHAFVGMAETFTVA